VTCCGRVQTPGRWYGSARRCRAGVPTVQFLDGCVFEQIWHDGEGEPDVQPVGVAP
jgi:hypothetical protein